MKRILLFAFSLALPTLLVYAQNADVTIIKKLNRQWLDAIVQEDSAALGRILADDFFLINPGGIRRTKADNISYSYQRSAGNPCRY